MKQLFNNELILDVDRQNQVQVVNNNNERINAHNRQRRRNLMNAKNANGRRSSAARAGGGRRAHQRLSQSVPTRMNRTTTAGSTKSSCATTVTTTTVGVVTGKNCAAILKKNSKAQDGKYTLENVGGQKQLDVYCDMRGGGWTLVFRSMGAHDIDAEDRGAHGDPRLLQKLNGNSAKYSDALINSLKTETTGNKIGFRTFNPRLHLLGIVSMPALVRFLPPNFHADTSIVDDVIYFTRYHIV